MSLTPEFIWQIAVAVSIAIASSVTTYTAIRADLARLHERATQALATADKANSRIDSMLGKQA